MSWPGRGTSMSVVPEQLVDLIQKTDNFVLMTHVHPDGDALGSLLALAEVLEGLGKRVFCYLEEEVSPLYSFMPKSSSCSSDLVLLDEFVAGAVPSLAAIALDCGDAGRLGREQERLLAISPMQVIDHHRGHRPFGEFYWVEPEHSSTGEMVYELFLALAAPLSRECAFNLYVAMVTDTGSFRYENTSSRTMRIAADLLDLGVNPEEAAGYLYDNYSLERLRLMEQVLATLELHGDTRIGAIRIGPEMLERCGATMGDSEGFINFPRSLSSVEVAVLFKEGEGDSGSVSMRAKGGCDVAQVAASFGGGGHRNAAGFRYQGQEHGQVRRRLLATLSELLAP